MELNGATVQYATLNNIDDIRRKGVKINSKVFIRRSNDVIPEIMGIAEDSPNSVKIDAPEFCPSCGSKLIRDGVHYFCENTLGCKPQLIKNIVHFAERKAMNIEGLSIKTIQQLMDANIINTIIDIYKLKNKKNEVLKLDRFAEKKFQNLIESIEKSKKCKLLSLVYALGIEGVGEKTAKDITKVFDSVNKLYNCKRIDLLNIEDVGSSTADSIHDWFNNEKNIKLLNELLTYITIEEDKPKPIQSDSVIKGQVFVVTGDVFKFKNRKELQEKIESLGGKVTGSVSAKTNYLINNDVNSTSGKNQKAKQLNIPIIDEDGFLEMIGE